MINKELLYQGSKIFYRVTGNGQTVVFIHGFGEDGNVWKNQIDFFKNDFRLIIPDLPGSGQSTMADGPWTIDRFAETIKALFDHEAITGGTMIGHSMGGYITLAFADKYPELLNGFGLLHSTAYADSEEKKGVRQKGIEFMKKHGGFEFLKTSVPNLFSPRTKDEMPGLVDEFLNSLRNFSADALVSYYEAMMQRPDRVAVFKKANVAVLLIAGEFDTAVPLKDSLELAHLTGKLYFHVLKKSGHMGMLEEAEKTNRLLRNYLNDLNPNSD